MNVWKVFKRFWVHAVLLAGCVVFAFPFLWLLGTSFKAREELGVFPPRWIPAIPWYTEQSPFVDGAAYDDLEAPPQVARADWNRVRGRIEEALAAAARETLGEARLKEAREMANGSDFLPQMVRGLWAQAREIVPEDEWKEPDVLPAFLARAVTAEMVDRAWNNIVRRLAIGDLKIYQGNNDLVAPESASGWQAAGPATLDTPAGKVEGEARNLIVYDLRKADQFSLVQTLRLPVPLEGDAATVTETTWYGAPREVSRRKPNIRSFNIPVRSDGSWYRLEAAAECGGRVFRAERPEWMEIQSRQEQEIEFAFQRPDYRASRVIVMEPDDTAATDVADPRTVRLTLVWHKSGRLRTALDKYINSYRWALRYIPFDRQLRNTILLVVLNVLGQLFAGSLAAYAFARLNFYGRNFLFGLLLATMMLPAQVTMIPNFVLWKTLGWYDTLRPLWVPAWFGSAFFIFLLRQFFMTIPKELEDAAKIDGCGFFGIYWRIMLPLAAPALATVAIFAFMGAWNEFVQPLVYLSDERLFPLSLGLNQFRQEQAAEWSWLMAASTMMMLPVIAVFFFCQRYFIQGVTLTGLKG